MKSVHSVIEKLRIQAEDKSASLPTLMLRAQKIAESILHGEHARRKPGSGENFWQFRDYMPTDRPEDIDWRQSAKGDDIFIKQKEWLVTRKMFFWCAGGKTMSFNSGRFNPATDMDGASKQEAAQVICMALSLLAQRSYEQIGIYGEERTGRSDKVLERLGHYLIERAHTRIDDASLPDIDAYTLPRHGIFVGVSDFLSPIEDIEKRFEALAGQTRNALIVQVLDPAEIELSFSGRMRFTSMDTQDEEIINNVANIRENYGQRITDHIKAVEDLCLRYGWHYQLHRTDFDITDMLKAVWETVEERGARK